MKLCNKNTGEIGIINLTVICEDLTYCYETLESLFAEWEVYKPKEPIIKDEKIRKMVREWAEYNETESVEVYNLIYDHGGICIKNALVRFYDPRLRTNIDVCFKKFEAPSFEKEREYTITELCGEEEE